MGWTMDYPWWALSGAFYSFCKEFLVEFWVVSGFGYYVGLILRALCRIRKINQVGKLLVKPTQWTWDKE